MTITATHLIIFLLLFTVAGICYVIYLLRLIYEFVFSIHFMTINIEEATKQVEQYYEEEDLPSAN